MALKRNSAYPQELYILHKNAIRANLTVRKIKPTDLVEINQLLTYIEEGNAVLDNIKQSLNDPEIDLKTFVFLNENVIVGVAVLR